MEIKSKFNLGSTVLVLEEIFGVLIVGAGEITAIERTKGLARDIDNQLTYKISFYNKRAFSIRNGVETDIEEAIKNENLLKFTEKSLYTREQEDEFKDKVLKRYNKLRETANYNFKTFLFELMS